MARRKHDPRLDDIDGRRQHSSHGASRPGTQRGNGSALDKRAGALPVPVPARLPGGAQALKQRKLHSSEGQVAASEGGVAAPEGRGVLSEAGEGREGRVGGRVVRDHLRVLLNYLCGRQDGAGDELGERRGCRVDEGRGDDA